MRKIMGFSIDQPDIDLIDPWDKSWIQPTGIKTMVNLYTTDWGIDCDDLSGTPVSSLPTRWKDAWMNMYFSSNAPSSTAFVSNATIVATSSGPTSPLNTVTGGSTGNVHIVFTKSDGVINGQVGIRDKRLLGLEDSYTLELPDKSRFVYEKGNYRIEDKDAKVTYKANRIHEFNRYLNSSDLLADFIADLGKLGARQDTALSVPIEVFITWLIYKAAEADGEPPPDIPSVASRLALPKPPDLVRCRCCAQPLPNEMVNEGLQFLNEQHMLVFMRRRGLR